MYIYIFPFDFFEITTEGKDKSDEGAPPSSELWNIETSHLFFGFQLGFSEHTGTLEHKNAHFETLLGTEIRSRRRALSYVIEMRFDYPMVGIVRCLESGGVHG